MSKHILSSAPTGATPLRCLILLAVVAAAPLTAGISSAQQSTATPFPIPDATNISPRLGPNSHDDDPVAQLAQAKRTKELNSLRQKQLTSEAAKLLALATELNTKLDTKLDTKPDTKPDQKSEKSREESSLLDLMHKAEQIEKLAHSVRAKMTDGATAN